MRKETTPEERRTYIGRLYEAYLRNRQVITDSRKAEPGTMFFALKGVHADGNDFVADVLAHGCGAVVTSDRKWAGDPRCFFTTNVTGTLQRLAAFHRSRFDIPVIGVTGSNGKTTTKELTCAVLRTAFRVHATTGNLNNHLGVPLTLLAMPDDTEAAVVEMGASHAGEIAELCRMVRPTHGIVTNVSQAHIGEFGSFETICRTKQALYRSVASRHGMLFVWAEHPLLPGMVAHLHTPKTFYAVNQPFVKGAKGRELRIRHACTAQVLSEEPSLRLRLSDAEGRTADAEMQLVGGYNAPNAAAAAAVGLHFGIPLDRIAGALSAYCPQNNRSQLVRTERNLLWVDCYNANPTSMTLSAESFLRRSEPGKMLILGDMGELGDQAPEAHRQVLEKVSLHGGAEIFTVGPQFAAAAQGLPRVRSFAALEELQELLAAGKPAGRFILLKGSRTARLEKLLELL